MRIKMLEIGDVVWLKSGGPAMTVGSLIYSPTTPSELGGVEVAWHADDLAIETATFPVACLTKQDPELNG